jgi:tRNA (guanine-N7-)-methyltransferase
MKSVVDIAPVTLEQIPPDVERQYDLAAIFGNSRPVELELGVGKGRYLIARAEHEPQTNFIGVEWANRYFKLVAERAARRGLANFRMVRDDSANVVSHALPDAGIRALHIYFPDPWPKARHHKRRLVQPLFARQCARVLEDGARVYLATDHEDYARQMEEVFQRVPEFRQLSRAVGDQAPEGVTNWEQRFRREGRIIHKFEFERKPRAGNAGVS